LLPTSWQLPRLRGSYEGTSMDFGHSEQFRQLVADVCTYHWPNSDSLLI